MADSASPSHPAPGSRPRPLHAALITTEHLGRIQPLALAPAWLAIAAISCWPWGDLRLSAGILTLVFIIDTGVGLALLPRTGRSFGPVTPSLLAMALVYGALTFVVGMVWPVWAGLALAAVLNLAMSAVFVYATWIEPFRIQVTREELRSPKLEGERPLRLLHLSDIHIERITAREREALRLAHELAPDIVILTGDYLNQSYIHDPEVQADAHPLLAELCATVDAPVYAVTGSPPIDVADVVPGIFADLPITWLHDEVADVRAAGHELRLAGLRCRREREIDVPRLQRLLNDFPAEPFTVLLYHSPDLVPEAAALGVDLVLCGHTHGGQIRLPLIGAVFTSSDFGKRYEMGRYQEGATTLYVNRGLGMEGFGAPRARLLARPEMVLWTLSG